MAESTEKANNTPRVERRAKKEVGGFLPFYTNAFDRVFISVVILIGVHLLWLRFMEPQTVAEIATGARPIELATVLSFLIGFFVVRYG